MFLSISSNVQSLFGSANIFFGNSSGYSNTEGSFNNCVGASAGFSNTTGLYNNYFGSNAGYLTTTGSSNSFLGSDAGYSNTEGSGNVFLGYQAGFNETGSNKLYISNSETDSPLIYGEFDNEYLEVNGDLNVAGYIQLDLTENSPPVADCDDPSEYGRQKVDAINKLLYICVADGWMSMQGGTPKVVVIPLM